ncbi:hypothetical protein ScalyP_jg6128 [Parmales sp. scaly parma]|nr:hypothetical protein ScalyP_jg6128 [Parmales sp. scaly parma]
MNNNLSVALIRAVIHAFYPDSYIAIVEILINDKFLREDDMDLRLSLPSRAIRKILEALRAERLVSVEIADDTSGDRNVKFWYIDYNLAVRVITYRIYLLQSRLNASAASTRSSAVFLCPSYSAGLCHGKYNEHEATRYVDFSDPNRARFLCHECKRREDTCSTFADIETYTLKQVDVGGKEGDLKVLKNKVQTQLSSHSCPTLGQLRPSIFSLLNDINSLTTSTVTSNLPSENMARGVGTRRIRGTGRTVALNRDMSRIIRDGGEDYVYDANSNKKRKDSNFLCAIAEEHRSHDSFSENDDNSDSDSSSSEPDDGLTKEERARLFQLAYKKELERKRQEMLASSSSSNSSEEGEEEEEFESDDDCVWED